MRCYRATVEGWSEDDWAGGVTPLEFVGTPFLPLRKACAGFAKTQNQVCIGRWSSKVKSSAHHDFQVPHLSSTEDQ